MVMIVSKRAGAVLAVAAGLCVAISLPALAQGFGLRIDGDRGNIEITPPQDIYRPALGDRGQATFPLVPAREARTLGIEARERAGELQRCFDRLGDFDDEAFEHRR